MDSVIIVARRGIDLVQVLRTVAPMYNVDGAVNERVVIESGGRRAYLGADPRIADEMEPEEVSRIVDMIPDPIFYTLDFSDISLCKDVLFVIADRSDVVVDNDHGVVLPGSEFVRVLRSQGDWDWRRDPPP